MIRGRVIKSTGSFYSVDTESGETVQARARGKFRNKKIRTTNPIAVGDWVKMELKEDDYIITEIQERHNYIVRKSVNLSKQSHIIASNIDQAVLVATLVNPRTLPAFIDRFCVAAEAYHIPVVIVFNKVDLLKEDEIDVLEDFAGVYADLGYRILFTSATEKLGLDEFRQLLQNKVSLLSGHSGVGKSTLINAVDENLDLRIGEISDYHQTGQHTTTYAEMLKLNFGGYIIDTPGIRGFGLVHIEKEELAGYFPEMRKLLPDCKFYNCLHIKEPGCAVKEAVENGIVAQTRYNSYLNMYSDDEEETYR
jgi:ribosome biogenesis GTPase